MVDPRIVRGRHRQQSTHAVLALPIPSPAAGLGVEIALVQARLVPLGRIQQQETLEEVPAPTQRPQRHRQRQR